MAHGVGELCFICVYIYVYLYDDHGQYTYVYAMYVITDVTSGSLMPIVSLKLN